MYEAKWETPDIEGMLTGRPLPEATTAANAGGYQVPIGTPLRAPDLTGGVVDGIPDEIPDDVREMLGLPRRSR